MSTATRRLRAELATDAHVLLGVRSREDAAALPEEQRIAEAQRALFQRMHAIIGRLSDVGISKARIAREIEVDAAALSELSDGDTSRLGFETLWEAYKQLVSFLCRTIDRLKSPVSGGSHTYVELLGFAGHPDLAKMKGIDALAVLGHNIGVTVADGEDALQPFAVHITGGSAVYIRDNHWFFVAEMCPGTTKDMTRVARDEIWHFEQWLKRQDEGDPNPPKVRSAY